ncbi:MAG: c-type cytochrome [Candidatus Rokubacteria bacterium]|nr:c-type cytochrome [Candidatus Rokubacteria bacterium]
MSRIAVMRLAGPLIATVVLAAALAAGVLAWSPASSARVATDVKVQRGQQVFATYCANCHGQSGKGDGLSGQSLPIKPQDLTQGAVLNPLPDHFLFSLITRGGQAVGLSPLMPPFKPQLSDTQVNDVIAYVRTLAQPAFDPRGVLPIPVKREGPVQPIFFSHAIHAGSYRIDCQYCHAEARRSSPAGLPSVERCMGCHRVIAAQGNPEVQKLLDYWERKEPIPWVRVFRVPEYVKFTHKNHVQAGLPCQTCHGIVEAMEQVAAGPTGQGFVNDIMNLAGMTPVPNRLTMGWCVECHRAANAKALASLAWIGSPTPTLTRAEPKAPLECVNCHH